MSKNSYSYPYECFGIDTEDQFIHKGQDKFINKFCASDTGHLCRETYFQYCIVLSRHILVYFLYSICLCFLPMWRINVCIYGRQ